MMQLSLSNYRLRVVADESQIAGYQDLRLSKIKATLANDDLNELSLLYKSMTTKDSHISSEIKRRKSRIRGQFIQLQSPNAKTQEKLDQLLATGEIAHTLSMLTSALEYGFFVGELWWDGANLNITNIPQTLIYKDYDGTLYLTNKQSQRVNIDERFLYFSYQNQRNTEASTLYSIVYLFTVKHFVLSNYLKFSELLGVPPIIVNASDPEQHAEIATNVLDLKSGGIGVFAKDDMVKVLEGKGTQAEFMEFIKYCDNQISIHLSGSTLTASSDGKGSLALGKVHENATNAILQEDCFFFAGKMREYLEVKLSLEGFDIADMTVNFLFEKNQDLKSRAETLQILTNMGMDIPADYLANEFNLPLDTPKTTSQPKQDDTQNEKNENHTSQILQERNTSCTCCQTKAQHLHPVHSATRQHNATTPKASNAVTQSLLDTLSALETDNPQDQLLNIDAIDFMVARLQVCQSYDEAMAQTLEAFDDLDMSLFITDLNRVLANVHIAGRAEVQDEHNN